MTCAYAEYRYSLTELNIPISNYSIIIFSSSAFLRRVTVVVNVDKVLCLCVFNDGHPTNREYVLDDPWNVSVDETALH